MRKAAKSCQWSPLTSNADNSSESDTKHGNSSDGSVPLLPRYTVFGSSTGLLAFYGLFGFRLRTDAWEILPCLVATAQECLKTVLAVDTIKSGGDDDNDDGDDNALLTHLRQQIQSPTERPPALAFHCGDMLTADLSHTMLLMLTSQCWDAKLIAAVYQKVRC